MLKKIILTIILTVAYTFSPAYTTSQTPASSSSDSRLALDGTGNFTSAPCMFKTPDGVTEENEIICGYLTVPSNRDQPEGQTIRLAVAIIKSKDTQMRTDPLFIAQGGPGGSTIDTYVEPLLAANSRLRKDRDIILFDQRGTLYSQPSLYCTEYDQLVMDYLNIDLSSEEYNRLFQDVMLACRQRLVTQGITLSDFNSLENARDIESLRIALGYEKINLYGVSYGTLLALHYMRLYPDSLRSVILDGVVAPQQNTILDNLQNEDRAFRYFFDSCVKDLECNQTYPDLETVFYGIVKKLEANPVQIMLTDPEDQISYPAIIDGEGFMGSVFQIFYVSGLIPSLPKMIYLANKGDFTVLSRIISIFVFDRSMSYGMYFSTWCAEDADFNLQALDLSNINPVIAEFEKNSPQEFLDTCFNWNVQSLGPEVDEPVVSDVPTLLLSGAYDPVTPESNAKAVAANLSRSYSITFPLGAHGQMLDNECSDGIILAFLENPEGTPDTSCITDFSQQNFYTQKTLITIPVILKLLNLESGSGMQIALLALALLLLSTAIFFLPLAWFVRLLQGNTHTTLQAPAPLSDVYPFPQEQSTQPTAFGTFINTQNRPSLLIRLSSWLAILNATILLAFCIAIVVILFQMISANDNRLFFGFAGEYRAWFILPPTALLLTVVMLIASIQGWGWKTWSIGHKIYYTLLAFAALICTGILGIWGMLTAFFS